MSWSELKFNAYNVNHNEMYNPADGLVYTDVNLIVQGLIWATYNVSDNTVGTSQLEDGAVTTLKLAQDVIDLIGGKAPESHADTTTKYGAGDSTHYGHVKVDNALDANSDNPVQNSAIVGALANKADLINGKLPVSQLPESGITVDVARALTYGSGGEITGDQLVSFDNKSLYNLGAYDTVSTANGITTITRQTGYLRFDVNDTLKWQKETYTNIVRYKSKQAIFFSSNYTISNIKVGEDIGDVVPTDNGYFVNNGNIYVYAKNNNFSNIENGLFQYKLATPYTQTYIEGQPINTLDVNQSQIVREDVENGLNLFDFEEFKSKTTSIARGNVNWLSNGLTLTATADDCFTRSAEGLDSYYKEVLANTKYTISLNANLSGSGYSVIIFYLDSNGSSLSFEAKYNTTSFSFTPPNNCKYINIRFGVDRNNDVCTFTNIMLNEGTHAYPYVPYNANKHITNAQAELLKDEFDRCSNLAQVITLSNTFPSGQQRSSLFAFGELEIGKTYTISLTGTKTGSNVSNGYGGVLLIQSDTKEISGVYATDFSSAFYKNENINASVNETFTATKQYLLVVCGGTGNYSFTETISNIMLNEGDTALPYQEYEGKIVHLRDLELYGTKPAIANVQCPIDLTSWNNSSLIEGSGESVIYLNFNSNYLGFIYLLPTLSSGSMTKGAVRYAGGDTDAFTWSINVITNNYIQLNCKTKFALYGPASSSGTLKTANYALEIEDMYGHTFSLPFSVKYRN